MSLLIPKVKDEVWTTKNGTEIEVKDMSEDHVRNTLRLIIKKIRIQEAFRNREPLHEDYWEWCDDDWGDRQ